MHLKPDEFIDLVDRKFDAEAVAHLNACDRCRRQLAALNATQTIAMDRSDDGAVPEPPPFFWSQLQNRVMAAVAAEEDARDGLAGRLRWLVNPRVLVPITAIAIILLSIPFGARKRGAVVLAPGLPAINNTVAVDPLEDAFDDDPSLQLVADLASSIDLSAASEAGLTPRGSADHAVTHLTAQELQELRRLLKAELGT
jgi:hypothetical protein